KILDAPADRRLAQGLLDYWKATLYTRGREPAKSQAGSALLGPLAPLPKALLADFDTQFVHGWAAAGDQALRGMSEGDRDAARRVLVRLVRLEPEGREFQPAFVRRAALEAAGDREGVGRAIQALVAAGVLRVVPGPTQADDQIGLRYDALVRTWE